MDATMRLPGMTALTELLTPYQVMKITGLGYENTKALMRVYGLKFGRRYYMTPKMLAEALEAKRRENK